MVRQTHIDRDDVSSKDHAASVQGVEGQITASGKVIERVCGNNAQRERRADQTGGYALYRSISSSDSNQSQ
jgi:hypothetical protein